MEFMKKVEEISKKIGETASGTYNTVVDKSGKIIEDTKFKFAISEREDKIYEKYADMGRTVYEMYKQGEDVGEVFTKESEEIDKLRKEIHEMNRKILANKGLKECDECGDVIDLNSNFCQHCGKEQIKVEIKEEKEEENKQKVCSNCNSICEENAQFCPNCGTEL